MSKRVLRKGTRKDYRKLADDVNGDLSTDGEQKPCYSGGAKNNGGGEQNKNEHNNNMDGEIINHEIFFPSDSDERHDSTTSGEISDHDSQVVDARKELEVIKKERKQLEKKQKSKLSRINRETQEEKKSVEKLKGKQRLKKNGGKKLTADSLRDMEDVMAGVDKLMDKKLKRVKKVVDSSDSEVDSCSELSSSTSDSSSSSDSDAGRKKKGKKRAGKRKDKGKGKHRSGKSKKLTSYVKYPQKWPHCALSLHFVNKEKKYEELSIAEFCAGYTAILEMSSDRKRVHKMAHLKELMYLATKYQWRCVLNYHAAVLLEIERGHLRWGDSFQILQSTTLAGGFLNANKSSSGSGNRSSGPGGSQDPNSGNKQQGTVFCRGYQRGTCNQSRDHYGWFNGENRLLRHICAKCWLKSRIIGLHPETSDSCPLKDEEV